MGCVPVGYFLFAEERLSLRHDCVMPPPSSEGGMGDGGYRGIVLPRSGGSACDFSSDVSEVRPDGKRACRVFFCKGASLPPS